MYDPSSSGGVSKRMLRLANDALIENIHKHQTWGHQKVGQALYWGPIHQEVEDHCQGLKDPIHQEM